MKKNNKIWQVKGRGPSVFIHDNRESAENEARRPANINPGQDFYVMEAVSVHRNISTERISLDGKDEDGSTPF